LHSPKLNPDEPVWPDYINKINGEKKDKRKMILKKVVKNFLLK